MTDVEASRLSQPEFDERPFGINYLLNYSESPSKLVKIPNFRFIAKKACIFSGGDYTIILLICR